MQGAWLLGLTAYILAIASQCYWDMSYFKAEDQHLATAIVITMLAIAGFLGFMAGKAH